MESPVRIDDMRLFASVADAGSFTAAAERLRLPKQTVSRRLAELEAALGVQLATRTTRTLRLTDVGRAYAERCREVVRLADEANRAVAETGDQPRGVVRITADPTFGEAFLPSLCAEYLGLHPQVKLEVVLTPRHVDLVDEGFDLAFRVGHLQDSSLVARRLGSARMLYCAAPSYLKARGRPTTPSQLPEHDCIELSPRRQGVRWPFRGEDGGVETIEVAGRIRVNSLPMAREIALAGLGIANLPAFSCVRDLASGRLHTVLDEWVIEVGGVSVVFPPSRFLSVAVRRFVDLAVERFSGEQRQQLEGEKEMSG